MAPYRRFGLAAAVALLVVACSGQAATPAPTATPTPTPTATPTPTPTPVPVGSTVLDAIQASDYSAGFTLKGTGTYGTDTLTTTGTWDIAGGDSHTATKLTLGTRTWTTDSIEVGGKSWESTAGGPYIPSPNTKCGGMADALGLATALTDEGVVTKAGQKVHHLTIDGGIDPSCSEPTSTAISAMTLTVDIYATEDGKIVSISQSETWTQMSSGSPLNATIAMEATPTGKPAAKITAPKTPWTLYEDTAGGYRVAVPAGWSEEMFQGRPSLRDAAHKYLVEFMVNKLPAGYTFAQYAKVNRDSLNALKSLKLNASQDADLGGEAGGLFEFHYTSGTTPIFSIDVYTVHGGNSVDVFWASTPGAETADLATYSTIVNSFAFTE